MPNSVDHRSLVLHTAQHVTSSTWGIPGQPLMLTGLGADAREQNMSINIAAYRPKSTALHTILTRS